MGISHHHLHRSSKQEQKDLSLKAIIEQVWKEHPSYGGLRLSLHLGINKKRVRRVMKKFSLKPPRRKAARRFCTQSTFHHDYSNLVRDITPTRKNQVWASDVSFFYFSGRWWYLATIKDIFTKQILAAQVSRHHDRFLILSVCKQAVKNTTDLPDIFHSDQGTEFMAHICTNFWEEKGVAVSVSDKASPWQNGYQESFFGRFKEEFGDINRFDSPGEFIAAIYQHIHYYNHHRIHTALKMPPAQFAQLLENPRHVLGT